MWLSVRDGLGISLGSIARTDPGTDEGATYRVTHAVTGAPGVLTVERAPAGDVEAYRGLTAETVGMQGKEGRG